MISTEIKRARRDSTTCMGNILGAFRHNLGNFMYKKITVLCLDNLTRITKYLNSLGELDALQKIFSFLVTE